MAQEEERSMHTVADVDQLIDEIQRQLDASDDFYRNAGIDRQKLIAAMTEHDKEVAARLLAEDLADVEREVQASAPGRSASAAARPSHSAMRRTMI